MDVLIGSGKLHDSILIRYDLLVSPKILSSLQGMGHVHYDIRKEEAGLLRNSEEKKITDYSQEGEDYKSKALLTGTI